MDGENHGKPYEQMDDLEGVSPYFWIDTHGIPWQIQVYNLPLVPLC